MKSKNFHPLSVRKIIACCAIGLAMFASPAPSMAQQSEPYNWRSVTIKANGFINGTVFSPVEKNLVYIFTDMGGAYRWDEPIGRWTPLNDWSTHRDPSAKHLGVEAMAVDPYDANRVYMVIGTYNSPAGFCRSTDKGKTWQRTNVEAIRTNGNGNGRNGGNRMVVDPNQPDHLWYGTRRDGVWRSTDGAATWTRVESFPATGDERGPSREVGVVSVLVDPASGQRGSASRTLYAFVSTTGADKVWRSTDAGATWSPLPGQPTDAAFIPVRAAITPDGLSIYITYSNSPGPNGASAGEVMKITNPSASTPTWTTLPIEKLGTHGWSGVCLDPADPNTILVSTLDRWGAVDDIYRSTDAGATWKPLKLNTNRDESSAPYARTSKPHWIGDVQIDPHDRNRAMFTTGYGMYDTRNLTAVDQDGAVKWTFFNEGFEQSAVLEFASPNDGPVYLFSAIGDRDGYRHIDFDTSPTEGTLGTSTRLSRGTSNDIDVAQNDHNKLVRLVKPAPHVQYSNDNGVTWQWIGQVPAERESEREDGSLALSADGNRLVYLPGRSGRSSEPVPLVYAKRNSDGSWGEWTKPSGEAPNKGKLIVDLAHGNTFYVIDGSTVSRSTDSGETWSVVTTSAPSSPRSPRAVPGKAGHLVTATANGSGAYRSTDGGATWTRMAPDQLSFAYCMGVGAAASGNDYPSLFIAGTVGDKTGYFRSDDQGKTWISVSDENQQFGAVTVIQGDSRVHGRLYVGSNGRGILVGERGK